MNFAEEFSRAVHTDRLPESEATPEILIPDIYYFSSDTSQDEEIVQEHIPSGLFCLLAGGRVDAEQFFSFSFKPLNAFLFIYTSHGSGVIHTAKNSYTLLENDFICINCSEGFSITCVTPPWNFKIFFFKGDDSFLLSEVNALKNTPVIRLNSSSITLYCIDSLLRLPVKCGKKELLLMNNYLNQIITEFILSSIKTAPVFSENVPLYLAELKNLFDNHFSEPFSLNRYEKMYKVNKYRICRDFSAYYGTSPLKYLTEVRMEHAKKMLLTTDLNIYEVSNSIGIDNVNHFINLFKRHTGSTPGAFRQQADFRADPLQ